MNWYLASICISHNDHYLKLRGIKSGSTTFHSNMIARELSFFWDNKFLRVFQLDFSLETEIHAMTMNFITKPTKLNQTMDLSLLLRFMVTGFLVNRGHIVYLLVCGLLFLKKNKYDSVWCVLIIELVNRINICLAFVTLFFPIN